MSVPRVHFSGIRRTEHPLNGPYPEHFYKIANRVATEVLPNRPYRISGTYLVKTTISTILDVSVENGVATPMANWSFTQVSVSDAPVKQMSDRYYQMQQDELETKEYKDSNRNYYISLFIAAVIIITSIVVIILLRLHLN